MATDPRVEKYKSAILRGIAQIQEGAADPEVVKDWEELRKAAAREIDLRRIFLMYQTFRETLARSYGETAAKLDDKLLNDTSFTVRLPDGSQKVFASIDEMKHFRA